MTNKALLIANWEFTPPDDVEVQYSWPALKGPKNDLKPLADALTTKPYGIFEPENIVFCENLDTSALGERIEKFFKQTETSDYVLVYFSGHGYTYNKKLRLVTSNAHKGTMTSGYSIGELDDCLAATSRAEQYVLILDCCYAGAAESGDTKGGETLSTLDAEVLPGRWALYSSDQYTTSHDAMSTDEPSPFTKTLCDVLIDPSLPANDDGIVTLAAVKEEMARRLRGLAGSPPTPQLNMLSNGIDPGIARRVVVSAPPQSTITELSHLGDTDDVLIWPVEVESTLVEVLSHLSALHDLATTLLPPSDRAKGRAKLELRVAEETQYLERVLGEALLRPEQIADLEEKLGDPTRLVRIQLSFPPAPANAVELLPWESLTCVMESDGQYDALAMHDGLSVERVGPLVTHFQEPDRDAGTVTEVALIGGQTGTSVQATETALRRDLAALGVTVSPAAEVGRYSFGQFPDLPPVVVILAALRGSGGSSADKIEVQFGADEWHPLSDLAAFLKPRRRTQSAPYRAIIIETFALDPLRDSAQATLRLAAYVAGLKLGHVVFTAHPAGSTGTLKPSVSTEPRTFVGNIVRALNQGYPLHRAVYSAKMRIRRFAQGQESAFGVPGSYQLTFAPPQEPRRGEASMPRSQDAPQDRAGSSRGSAAPAGDTFVATPPPATSIGDTPTRDLVKQDPNVLGELESDPPVPGPAS